MCGQEKSVAWKKVAFAGRRGDCGGSRYWPDDDLSNVGTHSDHIYGLDECLEFLSGIRVRTPSAKERWEGEGEGKREREKELEREARERVAGRRTGRRARVGGMGGGAEKYCVPHGKRWATAALIVGSLL